MKVIELSGLSRTAGGVYYAASSLCRALASQGLNLSVLGRDDAFVHDDQIAWNPVPTHPYRAMGPMGSSTELRRLLREGQAELCHLHGLWMDDQWAALQWQRKTGNPVVISPHGMLDPWALKNSGWKKKLVGTLFANDSLRRASCLHALCQSEVDSIRAYGLDNPVALIPNGVDLPEPAPPTPGHGEKEMKRLLFLGRIHPKKGLTELIEGWVQAAPKEWELIIAGWDDGGHLAGLEAQVDAAACADSISFTGPLFGAAKELQLRAADAFILPSYSEGLPMSVLEAWSYGVPVLMTEYCNLPIGFQSEAALRIEPNSGSIADGLRQMTGMSAEELTGMGANGRTLVEQKFTWEKIARDMKAVYEWCLGGDQPTCINTAAAVRSPH